MTHMEETKTLSAFQKFVKTGSLAGMLLFGTTIIALIWANSPFLHYYENLLQYELGFSFEGFELKKSLLLWINDGLMAIFFFLIGLELKRELLVGEINSLKKAAFPLIAALGGVIVPILLYIFLNENPDTVRGWGIPMATDIAFALAILSLLGKRVPLSLKVFLTAFAIIDDIAAVVVIAVFYSSNVDVMLLVYAVGLIGVLAVFYRFRSYSIEIGLLLALVVWVLFLKSGVHPTIAGVLLAFTIPIRREMNLFKFTKKIDSLSNRIKTAKENDLNFSEDNSTIKHVLTKEEIQCIDELDDLSKDVVSPLQHLEHKLHSLTAYFILPVFAFANAGVVISGSYDYDFDLMSSIAISLFIGKLVGVTAFSYLGIKLKLAELPKGLKFIQIIGVAAIAGVGFTMAIFIDHLAFAGSERSIISAKVGIIIGSLLAGIFGYLILRFTSNKQELDE